MRCCVTGGQFGFIVPSGIYTDKGTTDLRELFLDRLLAGEWLFGFENREKDLRHPPVASSSAR